MKAPTEEQLRDPAWWDENAPDDAEIVWLVWNGAPRIASLSRIAWAKWGEGIVCGQDQATQYHHRPAKPEPTKEGRLAQHIAERDAFLAEDEPQPQERNGEGLPPVGCECEYVPDPVAAPNRTARGVFIGRVNGEDFVDTGLSVDRMKAIDPARRFPKIRTQAEREREETVDEALGYLEYRTRNLDEEDELMKARLNALYDAGMLRKADA